MSQLIPPSAFENIDVAQEEEKRRALLNAFNELDNRFHEELQHKSVALNSVETSPQKGQRIYESAMKNQATLIEQLQFQVADHEMEIADLQQKLAKKQRDLELITQQCEMSLATLDEENSKIMSKVQLEMEICRQKLEKEVQWRLENEQKFKILEEKNAEKMEKLQTSMNEKIRELKEAREESAKLRLYFTGGRDLVSSNFSEFKPPAPPQCQPSESETLTNLRVQIEALQHIIDVQEEQLRTSKPDVIPGLVTLDKWRRKVYEMMVRTKLGEITVAREQRMKQQELNATKERLEVAETKLKAKDIELKEVKSRFESNQKVSAVSTSNEIKLRDCINMITRGIAAMGAKFKDTSSRCLLQLATMEQRLELASKRVHQLGSTQRAVSYLEQTLAERNSEKLSAELQVMMANESVEELRRQLAFCQEQLSLAAKNKATAVEAIASDRDAERESTNAHIRGLTSELQEIRVEHAKLISVYSNAKRKLEETEQQANAAIENLNSQLKTVQQDYDALSKVAREQGLIERVASRRLMSTPPPTTTNSDTVRAQVESLYKSVIR